MGLVSLSGSTITYRGNSGVDRVFVGSGLTFDFTQSLGGLDKVYFNGALADYSLSTAGSILTLTRVADSTVIRLNGSDSLDTLLFLDGSVNARALHRYAQGTAAAPTPVGETSSLSAIDVSASELNGLSTIRGFATSIGAVFGTVPAGAALQVRGTSGVETVYVKAGSQVDATQLLGSTDKIYLTGLFSDYTPVLTGSVLTFTRGFGIHVEAVRVLSGDSIIFADGTISSTSLINALRNGTALPIPSGETTPGVPVVESVAITSDAAADGYAGYYKAGDSVQVSVNFSETVRLTGGPAQGPTLGPGARDEPPIQRPA